MKPDEPQHVTDSRPLYPSLYCAVWPDLVPIARDLGYALMIHGTLARDLDLVAVPWVEDAADPAVLIEAIRAKFGAWVGVATVESGAGMKPHGRMGAIIVLGGHAVVDLSIMPRAEFATLVREREDAEAQVEAMSHVLAATKADLASARTALAEAKGVLARISKVDVECMSEKMAWIALGDIAKHCRARIDALAGEGG